eukprot:36897-Rhodomonas_salina.1
MSYEWSNDRTDRPWLRRAALPRMIHHSIAFTGTDVLPTVAANRHNKDTVIVPSSGHDCIFGGHGRVPAGVCSYAVSCHPDAVHTQAPKSKLLWKCHATKSNARVTVASEGGVLLPAGSLLL